MRVPIRALSPLFRVASIWWNGRPSLLRRKAQDAAYRFKGSRWCRYCARAMGFHNIQIFPFQEQSRVALFGGRDGNVMTAGSDPIGLVPKEGAKSGEICPPRERKVSGGTLVKLMITKRREGTSAAVSCTVTRRYLLKPGMPMRMVECRAAYKANVMGATVWDQLSSWGAKELEDGFEDGAGFQIELSTEKLFLAKFASSVLTSTRDEPRRVSARSLTGKHMVAATADSLKQCRRQRAYSG